MLKKAKSLRAVQRIRKHVPTFSSAVFPSEADAIYKEVNSLLPKYFEFIILDCLEMGHELTSHCFL